LGNSNHKNSVKDYKTSTGIWIISPLKKSEKDKIIKAYGKSLPEDEIRSIMGRAIPPEWTVNLLVIGKEPWRFKDLEDQLNMYRQQ
jgi:hypothetical protein